jgi:hypothetical protein
MALDAGIRANLRISNQFVAALIATVQGKSSKHAGFANVLQTL